MQSNHLKWVWPLILTFADHLNSEKKDCFVQEVTCAPEPMGVLATEQQLCDIVRFSTDHFNFILGSHRGEVVSFISRPTSEAY